MRLLKYLVSLTLLTAPAAPQLWCLEPEARVEEREFGRMRDGAVVRQFTNNFVINNGVKSLVLAARGIPGAAG
jgi:hypothetical protein